MKETDYQKLYEYLGSVKERLFEGLKSFQRMIPANQTSHYTHALHPYVAKFMPQYPNLFIRVLTQPGEIVLDPMCGSGTTLIEAVINGRNGYGIDIDPLAQIITKVATTRISDVDLDFLVNDFLPQVLECKHHLKPSDYFLDEVPNHEIWFRDDILAGIMCIRDKIKDVVSNIDLRDLAMVALSTIVKEVSNADPRDVMPEINHEKPINIEADTFNSFARSLKTTVDKVRQFTHKVGDRASVSASIIGDDARKINLHDSSVDLIVTSPPYAYAMDYGRIHKLSFFTLLGMKAEHVRELSGRYVGTDRISTRTPLGQGEGIEFATSFIKELSLKNRRRALALEKYLLDMRDITYECSRVLKPNRYFVYVVGNSTLAKSEFTTALALKSMGESFGLTTELIFERPYYARRMGRKRASHSAVTKSDVFIVFKK